jgi:L-ascorbate metabolism protein UlaG (beta-lactamase superfamily)
MMSQHTPADPASAAPRRRRGPWWGVGLSLLGLLGLGGVGLADAYEALGTLPSGPRAMRIAESPQFRGGRFVDTLPRVEPDVWKATWRWLGGNEFSAPDEPPPVLARAAPEFATPPLGVRVTWLGHSTLLVELEGRRVLIDPVFGERCSPSSFVGPRRFHPAPIAVGSLPPVDAVLISHDHYDHLDHSSVLQLNARGVPFIVPLGVGAHLEYWGVSPEHIHELDWWQQVSLGGLTFVATPARHFSGRGLGADQTLWSGWAVIGQQRRAYYSGDTAMFEGFAQIGARLGPFDVAMIEVGAYDALWADVHLGPEQAILAHQAVRAGVLVPVHWGTFDLALHSWIEPIERTLEAARAAGVRVVTPRPGQSIDTASPPAPERWWPSVPWKGAAEAPVVSSGLGRAKGALDGASPGSTTVR